MPAGYVVSEPTSKPDLEHIAADLRPLAVPIDALTPDARNARTHGEENLEAIRASLKRFGQREPLVSNRNGGVVESGNGRLEAAKSLGWSHVAVVWVEDDPAAELGYKVADNRTAELAEWDDDKLYLLIEEVREAEPDLLAACQLDDLFIEDFLDESESEGDEAAGVEAVPEMYKAIVTCSDQEGQAELVARLEREGYQCRALVL